MKSHIPKKLTFWPSFIFQICTKLSSTRFSASTSATVTTSTSFELASSHARVTSFKSTKQQWMSGLVTRMANDWLGSDKKLHKIFPPVFDWRGRIRRKVNSGPAHTHILKPSRHSETPVEMKLFSREGQLLLVCLLWQASKETFDLTNCCKVNLRKCTIF